MITELTEHLMIYFNPWIANPNNRAKRQISMGHMVYTIDSLCEFVPKKQAKLPWQLSVNMRDDVENPYNDKTGEIDANKEIDDLFRERAIQASNIVDHNTFCTSEGWYMLLPLLRSKQHREHYGVKLMISKNVQKLLFKQLFSIATNEVYSLYNIIHYNRNNDTTLCTIDGCKCRTKAAYDGRNNRSNNTLFPKSYDEHIIMDVVEAATSWGIPLKH